MNFDQYGHIDYFTRYVRSAIEGVKRQKRHSERMREINRTIGDLYTDKVALQPAGQARLERKALERFERESPVYLDLDISNSYRRRLQTAKRQEILDEADRVLNKSQRRPFNHESNSYKKNTEAYYIFGVDRGGWKLVFLFDIKIG